MVELGYHASHEQFSPETLRDFAIQAEAAGFRFVLSSDHFHPWSPEQGHSGFTWSWLGAAMQATSLPFGSLATPIGFRYHPTLIAQAGATLARLFPGRLPWIAMGSGEAVNETITGAAWPSKQERNERLLEAVEIVRALWAGDTVTRSGHIETKDAKLYSRPDDPPKLIAAVLSPETARWAGSWADGLITVNQPHERLRTIVEAFAEGGGEGKPLALQIHVSYAETDEQAKRQAFDEWRWNCLPPQLTENLERVEQFVQAARSLTIEDVCECVHASADLDRHAEWIEGYAALGFGRISVHNTGTNQSEFIEAYAAELLPRFAPPAAIAATAIL